MKNLLETETILVPHDFTNIGDFALLHANQIAKNLGKSVSIAHIVKNENEKREALEKIEKIADENQITSGVETKFIVAVGDYLKKIGEIADIAKATLAVMGTHGVRGVQKLIGSYALKVITQSDIPFIVVQSAPTEVNTLKNIVVPIDFSKESKQKLYALAGIAQLFKSQVHVIADYESDDFIAKQLENNVRYAAAFLNENKIEHVIYKLDKKNNGIIKETIAYSFKVRADLIVVMTSTAMVFNASEQALITNDALVPVMCMNPIKGSILAHGMSIAHGG